MEKIKGIPASYGIAVGSVFVYKQEKLIFTRGQIEDPEVEWSRFEVAQQVSRQQLEEIYEKAKVETGKDEAEIFSAHLLMLDDPDMMDGVKNLIFDNKWNAETAVSDTIDNYATMLEEIDNEYMSARALDIKDIGKRLLRNLLGKSLSASKNLTAPSIIFAEDLTPSDTILLDKSFVLGFCTSEGGATSHTAILARSLGIPAVVGTGKNAHKKVENADLLIVDGDSGLIIIDPDEVTLSEYQSRQQQSLITKDKAGKAAHKPAITVDGHRVKVVANIGSIEDAQAALEAGAEGVGLLRSEFLYLERSSLPTEEEQYNTYKKIGDTFGDMPIVLRTLDVGGDKEIPYIDMPEENNPFLGVRAIRLCLDRPHLFKPQLRAVLRAGYKNKLKMMFPMVATLKEVKQARAMLEECRQELIAEGHQITSSMEIGIMVEVPSTAIMADQFAEEVDFFSIGTNDLTQYTMAADRTNANIAQLTSGFQPAIFRLIKQVIDAAHAHGKWVGLCGEMAGELTAIPILLGLGLDEFSMNSPAIPYAKYLIRSITLEQAKKVAQLALDCSNDEEIRALVIERVPEINLE